MDPKNQESEPLPAEGNSANPYASSIISEPPVESPVSFLSVAGIVVATMASSFIVFCTTWFAVAWSMDSLVVPREVGLLVAWALGLLVAIFVGYYVGGALWLLAKGE